MQTGATLIGPRFNCQRRNGYRELVTKLIIQSIGRTERPGCFFPELYAFGLDPGHNSQPLGGRIKDRMPQEAAN
jgi:hypothetical protein